MIDFLAHYIVPLLKIFFVPFDVVFGWLTMLGFWGALIAAGAITGLAVNLFQKYCSDQEHLGRRKADIEKLKALTLDAKKANDMEKVSRLTGLTGQISSKLAIESLKPALYSVLPLCLFAMWVGERLSYAPVRPKDVVEVVGTFEDGATGFAHVVPNAGISAEGQAIVSAAVQAQWKIRAEAEGDYALLIRHGEDRYTVPMSVRSSGGRPPDLATVFRTESPTHDRLLSLEMKLREPMPKAWWNVWMQAMGIYLIVALVFGVVLRWALGIK